MFHGRATQTSMSIAGHCMIAWARLQNRLALLVKKSLHDLWHMPKYANVFWEIGGNMQRLTMIKCKTPNVI